MDMELSEEQALLKTSAREFLERACPLSVVRESETSELGFPSELWRQMAELGWLGLPLPPEHGGAGLDTVTLVVLAKELGRALCPSPYLPTVVLGAGAIAAAGTLEQQRAYLPRIAAGETVIAFAFLESSAQLDPRGVATRAAPDADGFVLSGTKMFVEFAAGADALLVAARVDGAAASADGLSLFLVDPRAAGVTITPLPTMARDKQARVALEGVRVPHSAVVGPVGGAWSFLEPVLHRGVVTFSAYAVGAAEKMHELATDFAKDRVQFGRPIGSFQLIQSYLAQLITEIWGAETLTYYAAWALDEGLPARELVAKTKAFAGDTVKRTTDIGSQIFGGIGYMEEMDTTLFLRRGKQLQLMLGDTGYWEDLVAEEILDREEAACD